MTVHIALTFIDEENQDAGYILGSDSNWSKIVQTSSSKPQKIIDGAAFREKAFIGNNYIGLFMGTAPRRVMKLEDWERAYELMKKRDTVTLDERLHPSGFHGLDKAFNNIGHNVDYTHLPQIRDITTINEVYTILIASRTNRKLELFVITNEPSAIAVRKNRAFRLHQIEEVTLAEIRVWFLGPGVPRSPRLTPKGYFEEKPIEEYSLERAIEKVTTLLQFDNKDVKKLLIGQEDYNPGKPNLYIVSFKRLGRIPKTV